MSYKIIHLTTVHPRSDTRIFIKQCSSLAKKYKLALVVADGLGDDVKNDVNIFDIGKFNGRINRIKNASKAIYNKALELNAEIYHIHDPELISVGIKLKKNGKKVVFDAHEDFPKQILTKHYLNPLIKKILSTFFEFYERKQCSKFDGIITATPYICNKFLKINTNAVDINNFPIIEEFNFNPQLFNNNKLDSVCYVGAIDSVRGVKNNIIALPENRKIKLLLAGKFSNQDFYQKCQKNNNWKHVEYYGFADRDLVQKIFSKSFAGMVTLLPTPSYLDSLPVKMFEYMAYGLPVIASNFPYWKEIIEKNECGLCVDPEDPKDIEKAIITLSNDLELCQRLGHNGRKAILESFNWIKEEEKLFKFYEKLLSN